MFVLFFRFIIKLMYLDYIIVYIHYRIDLFGLYYSLDTSFLRIRKMLFFLFIVKLIYLDYVRHFCIEEIV
jgi:hypothetical protein